MSEEGSVEGEEEQYPPAEIYGGFSQKNYLNPGVIELDIDDDEIREPSIEHNYAQDEDFETPIQSKVSKKARRSQRVTVLDEFDNQEEADFMMKPVKAKVFEIGSSLEKDVTNEGLSHDEDKSSQDQEPVELKMLKSPKPKSENQSEEEEEIHKILKKTLPND